MKEEIKKELEILSKILGNKYHGIEDNVVYPKQKKK